MNYYPGIETPGQILETIKQISIALQKGNDNLKTLAIEKEKTLREYKVEKAKKICELRENKIPVSLVSDLANGDELVSELKMKQGIAESNYFIALEAMQNLRLELESLRSNLTWQRVELNNQ